MLDDAIPKQHAAMPLGEERIGVSACGRVGVALSLVVRNFYKPQEA